MGQYIWYLKWPKNKNSSSGEIPSLNIKWLYSPLSAFSLVASSNKGGGGWSLSLVTLDFSSVLSSFLCFFCLTLPWYLPWDYILHYVAISPPALYWPIFPLYQIDSFRQRQHLEVFSPLVTYFISPFCDAVLLAIYYTLYVIL